VYASDGRILAVLRGSQARVIVPSAAISPCSSTRSWRSRTSASTSTRDRSARDPARALEDITHGSAVQGGSTITQQYVKNAYNGNAPTITRKLREAALAWQLEQVWSKDKILTAYLNTIYFGNGAYGSRRRAASTSIRPPRASPRRRRRCSRRFRRIRRSMTRSFIRSRRSAAATSSSIRCSASTTSTGSSTNRRSTPPCRAPTRSSCRRPRARQPLLRQLRLRSARRPLRCERDLRWRAQGDNDARPGLQELAQKAIASVLPARSAPRRRWSRSTPARPRARDGGWTQL